MSSKGKRTRPARAQRAAWRRTRWISLALLGGIVAATAVFIGYRSLDVGNAAPVVATRGVLTAVDAMHDFGQVSMRDGKVAHTFRLRNTGGDPALVEKIFTSCMCTEASLVVDGRRFGPFGMPGHGAIRRVSQVVPPGAEVAVEAVFDPNAHGPAGIGRNDRVISVELGGQRTVQLAFTAFVTP